MSQSFYSNERHFKNNACMKLLKDQFTELLFQTIQQLRQARELENIYEVFVGFAHKLSFDRIIICSVSPYDQDELIDQIFFTYGDWVDQNNIAERDMYLRRCPITSHIFEYDEPFFWAKTYNKDTSKESYRIIKNSLDKGDVNGVQIPIFGRTGLEGAISFAGEIVDMSADFRFILQAVATVAFREIQRRTKIHNIENKRILTGREKEVLKWTAIGRKHSDIAEILEISVRTVENHLRNIRKRLGVKSTAQAISSALISREIEL